MHDMLEGEGGKDVADGSTAVRKETKKSIVSMSVLRRAEAEQSLGDECEIGRAHV